LLFVYLQNDFCIFPAFYANNITITHRKGTIMKKYNNANQKPIGNPMPAMRKPLEIIAEMHNAAASSADPNGSYTGRPVHPDEKPVQDADDL
jgi:hypothetical protein